MQIKLSTNREEITIYMCPTVFIFITFPSGLCTHTSWLFQLPLEVSVFMVLECYEFDYVINDRNVLLKQSLSPRSLKEVSQKLRKSHVAH